LKTVLLAEHHLPTLEHLAAALSQAGFQVLRASDAGRAMELFTSDHPKVVVVAVELPRLQGSHLGKLIRASERGARVPMVAIDKGHLGKAKGVGAILDLKANAYVADPLKGHELVSKVEALYQSTQTATEQISAGLAATLGRPPVASADLKGFPLPALIHSVYRLNRDGVLVVAHRDLVRRVFFLKGSAVSYDSTARQDSLVMYLVERKDLTAEQADSVLQSLAQGVRISAALAEAGAVLETEDLLQRLRDFTRDKVAQLVGMREGRYAFYAGAEFEGEVVPVVDIPALSPILEGARRSLPVKVLNQSLRAHSKDFPVRTPEFGKDLPVLGLDTGDLKIAMQINGRIALSELLAFGRGDLRDSYSLLWFLNLTGSIAFSKTPAVASDNAAYAGHDRIAPRRRKPLPEKIAAELRDAAVRIITSSYFRVLGLDITADSEAVERAYHQVATRFHPDSYPEYDTSEIKDLLDSVQEKLSASYRVLSLEEKRKAYLTYLLSRLDIGRAGAVNVDAEIALKRGEAALRRKDLRSAVAGFEEAIALNPREPEYYCYLAWATYQSGAGNPKSRAAPAQRLLKKALSLNPELERALIIGGIIDAETGDHASARKRLLKVLEMNPASQLAKAALRRVGR
jgi:DNA-binding response OmpR family regulator/tetratricopeptide (TPR) repeat protein